MSEENQNTKVIGIPTDKYLKICYILVLISSVFWVLNTFLALIDAHVPGTAFIGLLGLIGIILAILGWFVFSKNFSALEISHFKYLLVLTAVVIVISVALTSFGTFFTMLISVINFACLFIGYKTWGSEQEATKDNLINSFNTLKSSFKNK